MWLLLNFYVYFLKKSSKLERKKLTWWLVKKSRSRGSESPFWKIAWRGSPGVSSIRNFPTIQRIRNFTETIQKSDVLCLNLLKSTKVSCEKNMRQFCLWMRSSQVVWIRSSRVCGWDLAEWCGWDLAGVDEIKPSLWVWSSWVCVDEIEQSLWMRSSQVVWNRSSRVVWMRSIQKW